MNSLQTLKLSLIRRYQSLPANDKRALMLLAAFMLIAVFAASIWISMKSTAAQQRMHTSKQNLLDLREMGARMGESGAQGAANLAELASSARQAEIELGSTRGASGTQINATHPSISVLSGWVASQIQGGVRFDQLKLEQPEGSEGMANLSAQVDLSAN